MIDHPGYMSSIAINWISYGRRSICSGGGRFCWEEVDFRGRRYVLTGEGRFNTGGGRFVREEVDFARRRLIFVGGGMF